MVMLRFANIYSSKILLKQKPPQLESLKKIKVYWEPAMRHVHKNNYPY